VLATVGSNRLACTDLGLI